MAYCNVSRMDFAPLLPHATPVTLTDADMTEAELTALRTEIAADPTRRFVDVPPKPLPFTHYRALRPPMLWAEGGLSRETQEEFERLIAAEVAAALNGAPHALRLYNDRHNYASFYPDEADEMVWGSYISTETGAVVLPRLYLYAPYVKVSCAPDDCARLDHLNLTSIVTPLRPKAVLAQALAAAVPFDKAMRAEQSLRDPAAGPHDYSTPNTTDLADLETRLAETQPYTTRVRHIAPRSD